MSVPKPTYKVSHIASSIFMVLTLLWLTISTPFVYEELQKNHDISKQMDLEDEEEECPLSNTTEEKSERSVTTLSEYLHDTPVQERSFLVKQNLYKCHPSDLYFAFHPELVSPPPKAASLS